MEEIALLQWMKHSLLKRNELGVDLLDGKQPGWIFTREDAKSNWSLQIGGHSESEKGHALTTSDAACCAWIKGVYRRIAVISLDVCERQFTASSITRREDLAGWRRSLAGKSMFPQMPQKVFSED